MGKLRGYLFLRDILWLSCFAFGGSQAHFPIFLHRLVHKRRYLSEEELLELQALCQILPGPTSTQMLVALAYRRGGPRLAYLTLLTWCLPALFFMLAAAVAIHYFSSLYPVSRITRFIQPMAVAFVAYAVIIIWRRVAQSRFTQTIAIAAAGIASFLASPYILPLLLVLGGLTTALFYKQYERQRKERFRVPIANLLLWGGVFVAVAILANLTRWQALLLFENFYRNGSMIFGGGQVFVPFLFTEFVDTKQYLTSEEFLSGFAFMQGLPGPIFAFSAYIGGLAMRDQGLWWQLVGGILAAAGFFLPGTFLVFFSYRIWDKLKRYRPVRASLAGIHAVGVGLLGSAAVILFIPLSHGWENYVILGLSVVLLLSKRITPPWIVGAGIFLGIIW